MATLGVTAKVRVGRARGSRHKQTGAAPRGMQRSLVMGSPPPGPRAALREEFGGPSFIMNLEESMDNQLQLLPLRNPF